MMVCDVCWSQDLAFQGQPSMKNVRKPDSTGEFLFGSYPRMGATDMRKIDLCPECMKLFQARDWAGIASRSHQALIKQLET